MKLQQISAGELVKPTQAIREHKGTFGKDDHCHKRKVLPRKYSTLFGHRWLDLYPPCGVGPMDNFFVGCHDLQR